jgi:hypothetical protein
MKRIVIGLVLLSIMLPAFADHVSGYYRSNGTYVQSYERSSPNYTQRDNYSTKGNYNSYTGQEGTVNVDTPSHNYGYNYSYGSGSGLNSGYDSSNPYRY